MSERQWILMRAFWITNDESCPGGDREALAEPICTVI